MTELAPLIELKPSGIVGINWDRVHDIATSSQDELHWLFANALMQAFSDGIDCGVENIADFTEQSRHSVPAVTT